jgi:anti-anti-sigma regulatory factor
MTVKTDCIEEFGRVLLIRCGGPLDGESGSSAARIEDVMRRTRRSGARIVLLDLLHTPYADSGGLRWLLALKRAAEAEGLTLRVVCARDGRVRRNIVLLRAGLELYDDVHRAWSAPLHEQHSFGTARAHSPTFAGVHP